MTAPRRRRNPATVIVDRLQCSGVFYGPVRVLHPAIQQVGCAWQYDHQRHAYLVPRQRMDDVMAAIEASGHLVQMQLSG